MNWVLDYFIALGYYFSFESASDARLRRGVEISRHQMGSSCKLRRPPCRVSPVPLPKTQRESEDFPNRIGKTTLVREELNGSQ